MRHLSRTDSSSTLDESGSSLTEKRISSRVMEKRRESERKEFQRLTTAGLSHLNEEGMRRSGRHGSTLSTADGQDTTPQALRCHTCAGLIESVENGESIEESCPR